MRVKIKDKLLIFKVNDSSYNMKCASQYYLLPIIYLINYSAITFTFPFCFTDDDYK